MLFPERARAERSLRSDVASPVSRPGGARRRALPRRRQRLLRQARRVPDQVHGPAAPRAAQGAPPPRLRRGRARAPGRRAARAKGRGRAPRPRQRRHLTGTARELALREPVELPHPARAAATPVRTSLAHCLSRRPASNLWRRPTVASGTISAPEPPGDAGSRTGRGGSGVRAAPGNEFARGPRVPRGPPLAACRGGRSAGAARVTCRVLDLGRDR